MNKNAIIEINHITKTFTLSKKQMKLKHTQSSEFKAVDDLSLKVYEGELYGLLGPNGAGKTTTLRMLASLIQPNSGDIIIDGISIKENDIETKKNIAFLTSELKLEDFFTPNYLFTFFGKLHQLSDETIIARKNILFSRFQIDSFSEIKVSNLSTGMKQKVSLAISLVHDPKIIIFDEPTNGLDVLTAKDVTDFLIEEKNRGKTIIISTHIFSLIEKISDRVGIIIDGKLTAEAPLKELTKDESLENVFFKIYQENHKE
ncbi:MAG: ATP-binding cassette domain-containing protein [Erysipelotrichaceae bacterium]|jgi:sodium transport system ATP-binding protein|nr:ATP-binding cassette domain-containing protein [Erysipelotrichaceae bacterium]